MDKTVDLSHILQVGMPVYPGTEPPVFDKACNIETEGFAELKLSFYSHTGTHLDAPSHILKGNSSLDELNVDQFIGKGIVLPHSIDNCLSVHDVKNEIDKLGCPDFILIQTSWDKFWGEDQYFSSCPLPDIEVFQFLCTLGLKGIGIDAISIDEVGSEDFQNHKLVLGSGTMIIENLTGLNELVGKYFDFFCFPLRIKNGDGSPIRAVAKYS